MDSIIINEDNLFEIIKAFYADNDSKNISVEKSLRIEDDDLSLSLYLIKDGNKYVITREDLEYVFKFYLHSCGLEYLDFKFVGHIRYPGYFIDEEKPIFEGVKLFYCDKEKTRKLVP